MADKDLSVNISVGTTVDEKSVKETERKIQEILAKGVSLDVNVDTAKLEKAAQRRAERGLPPRVPKGRPVDFDFADLFKKNLFNSLQINDRELKAGFKLALPVLDTADPFSGIGESLDQMNGQFLDIKQKIKEADAEFSGESSRIDFAGKISDELETIREIARDANELTKDIAKNTGVSTLKLDYLKPGENEFEAEVSDLLSGFAGLESGSEKTTRLFTLIGDTLVPSVQVMFEAYQKSLQEAAMLNVPVAAFEEKYAIKPRMANELPRGRDRSGLGESKQAQRVQKDFENQLLSLATNPETSEATASWLSSSLSDIAESIWEKTVNAMQETADYYSKREFKGGPNDPGFITKEESTDIRAGSNELGYWLEDIVTKFRQFALARGFEPGSEAQIVDFLRSNRENLTAQEGMAFPAIESGFLAIEQGLQNFTTNLDAGSAALLEEQVLRNAAILTEKPLGGGAQKEIKTITTELPEQIKSIQALGEAAKQSGESVQKMDYSLKDVNKFSAEAEITQLSMESNDELIKIWQNHATKQGASAEQVAAANKEIERLLLDQAEAEKKLIQLKAKLTAQEAAQIEEPAPELESGFEAWQRQFLEKLSKLGQVDEVAFDTEFNRNINQWITEAAVTVKDGMGNIVDIFEMIHAPASATWRVDKDEAGKRRVEFQPRSREEVEKIAAMGNIPGGIGSTDPTENFIEFYEKIQKLSFVLKTLSDQGAVIVGSNAGETDLNTLGKAIEWINKASAQIAPQLSTIEDFTPGVRTSEPNKIVAQAQDEAAKVLTASGASLSKMMAQILEHFSDLLTEEQKQMFRMGKSGLEVKVQNLDTGMEAWLPAHFAKVDNRIALAIKSVLDQILPVDSSRIRETENYAFRRANKESKEAPRVPRSASGSGAGEPPQAGAVGSGDAASNAVKYFLATTQVAAIQAEMTQQEEKLALQATKKLQAQSEYKKLLEKVLGLREEIADLEAGGAGADVIRARKDDLNRTIVTGRTLERQMFEQVKATARAGDVAKKYQNTAAKTVDTQIELERSSKKAFSGEIRAQMQAQVNAAKDVERQTKNLVNTWVTGRYALYDVGNAYAEVSRQLWMASRQIFNITQAYRSYETAFTSVERAIEPLAATLSGSKDEAASLQEAFINLSEEIPVSFEEIAKIATLGAQMGVTASGIVDFTKVVSEFSSVTGVSADTVAQKFGRIAELANVDYSQFANLGSSILYAGINAVATEPEIMTLSESIAAVSAQAGMVPSEIVGMATALASTGIQAEQARGVFTRVFADIDRAVSRGGTGLDNFAAMAGMSAENFAKAWGTEGASYDVFRAILGGLGATEDLTSAFDSLNIVETREINTLTRLAENLNVVDQAISDANSSFESGAFLAESFQKTVDNLDSKIAMFNNNVKALTVELSKSLAGGLSFVLEIANKMLQVFKEMAKNETFAGFAFGGLAVTALGAAATLAVSAMAKLIAQVYAFRVAAINTANDSTAMSGMKDMFKQLTGWGGGLIEMRDQLKSVSPDVRGVITPVTGRMADHLGDSFATLGNKVGLFGDELKSTDRVKRSLLKTDNIYLANTRQESDLITQLIAQRADEIQSIEMRTGSIMHSYQATVAEQSAINKGEATIESINAARAKERALLLDAIGGKQLHVTTVNGETVAYTKNQIATDNATLSSKLATQQEKAEAAARLKNKTALDLQTRSASKASKMSLGPGAIVMGAATAAGGILAVVTTIMTVVTAVQAAIEATKVDLLESGGGLASLRDAIKQDTIEYQKLTEEQKRTSDNYSLINVKTRTYATETNKSAEAIREATGASQSFVDANQKVKEGVESTTFALGEQTRAWIANAMMQDENLLSAIEKYPELLNSLEGYGVSFGEILNQVMQNPDADPIANLRKEVAVLDQEIRRRLTPNVFDEANNKALDAAKAQRTQLEMTIQTVDSLRGALSSATSTSEIFEAIRAALGLDSALEETTETANGLSDALRTVLDYASDLNGMLSRVVELEFGKQMSRDNITSGWRDLTKSVNDSKEAIEEANKEIKGLTADRDVLQYQLSVAERYGDEVRAAKIRAELAKVNKQVTDSEKKLAEAQADSSTALTGDSDAAIKNRSELLKMVGVYQSHIEMLAKLGMNRGELEESADALKRQFLAEAKALGFSGKQLEDYAGLFDNFADTAANAPRDVDIEVKLGLTAAEQAITEFTSKNRSTNVGVKVDTKDADKKGSDLDIFLNKNREVKARLEKIETLAADGSLKSWLKLEREFGAPKVTNITADAADTKIRNWLTKERSMAPAIMSVPHFLSADNAINVWLKRGREMQVDVVASMKSSSLASAQATAAFDLARILPPGTHRDSYNEMGRMLNKVAGDLRGRGMAAGGLVTGPGSGTSDSIPTMLSNGEYVVKANAVKTYGVDFFNALNQQRMGFAPVSGGRFNGQQQQGPTIVFLSPEDRQLLRQFGDRPVNLYADSTKIAEVANSGNTKMSRRGTR